MKELQRTSRGRTKNKVFSLHHHKEYIQDIERYRWNDPAFNMTQRDWAICSPGMTLNYPLWDRDGQMRTVKKKITSLPFDEAADCVLLPRNNVNGWHNTTWLHLQYVRNDKNLTPIGFLAIGSHRSFARGALRQHCTTESSINYHWYFCNDKKTAC